MGIKGFKRDVLLDAVTPDVLVKDIVQKHRITRIIVDFSSLLHAALRPVAEDVVDENNENALMGLLDSFYSKISFLRAAGMEHLHFVRDGAPTPAKALEVAKRRAAREAALQVVRSTTYNTETERKKACQNVVGRASWMEEEIARRVIQFTNDSFVITIEVASHEADGTIAARFLYGVDGITFHAVWAEDQDMYALMGPRAVMLSRLSVQCGTADFVYLSRLTFPLQRCSTTCCKNLPGSWRTGRDGDGRAVCQDCSAGVGLTWDQIILACIINGTDYWNGLQGVAMKRACALMRTHGTVEGVIDSLKEE